ncbi:MAG: znuB [Ignavibacteria bacterium]|nr:znuB [Ignavibacteria bacterium]
MNIIDAMRMPFLQKALAGAIIVGFLASYYGVFIVQRKMSFLGSGLAHSAFGGVALGLLLEIEPLLIAVPFTITVAVAIIFLKNKTGLGSDTSIGILFAVSMALGIIFLSIKKTYSADAYSYLFGSILSVFNADLILGGIVALATIIMSMKYWKRWAYSTFDQELASSDHVPVIRDDYLLSIMIGFTIVIAMKIAGIVLIAAFLVIPAAAARMLAKTFFGMTAISVIIGTASAIAGLVLSFFLDLPSGAVIIMVQAVIFLIFAIIRGIVPKV